MPKMPRKVYNLFRFLRLASPDLNPSLWRSALGYLEELKAAMGVAGDPKYIYEVLNKEGWKGYPLPSFEWGGASLRQPWTTLRGLTGGVWDGKELRRLAEEALEKGVAWVTPPSLKYSVKIGFRVIPSSPGYETSVAAEYRGMAHGHYGFVVNWRGTVFLAESD